MAMSSNQEIARDMIVAYINSVNKMMPAPGADPRETGRYIARMYRTVLRELSTQPTDRVPSMSEEDPKA